MTILEIIFVEWRPFKLFNLTTVRFQSFARLWKNNGEAMSEEMPGPTFDLLSRWSLRMRLQQSHRHRAEAERGRQQPPDAFVGPGCGQPGYGDWSGRSRELAAKGDRSADRPVSREIESLRDEIRPDQRVQAIGEAVRRGEQANEHRRSGSPAQTHESDRLDDKDR